MKRNLPELREIVSLRLEGLTAERIAARVGLCEKTVRNRLLAVRKINRVKHTGSR